MGKSTITEGQSLVDVSLQELGAVAGLFDLADAAGLGITDLLTPGQVLVVPASPATVPSIAGYFSQRRQRINTGDKGAGPGQVEFTDFDFPDFDNSDFFTN